MSLSRARPRVRRTATTSRAQQIVAPGDATSVGIRLARDGRLACARGVETTGVVLIKDFH
jgi:hypothetical protein